MTLYIARMQKHIAHGWVTNIPANNGKKNMKNIFTKTLNSLSSFSSTYTYTVTLI